MIWDPKAQNLDLLKWYQSLIALRREYPILRHGQCRTVWADSTTNVYGFVRFDRERQALILLNNRGKSQSINLAEVRWPVALPKQVQDLLTKEKFALGEIILEPYRTRILG